jgi:Zn-dependent oligopeptidase
MTQRPRGDDRDEIGVLLLDNFARPGKQLGLWIGGFHAAETSDGAEAPIVANNNVRGNRRHGRFLEWSGPARPGAGPRN